MGASNPGRRSRLLTLAVLGAAGVFLFLLVPSAPATLDTDRWQELAARTAGGAYHVHTTRSDGHGDRRQIAAEARRAGLAFVILTDHGDGTRPPDPPEYVDGVLLLDAVEVSTEDGHYVALDMPRAPYPLGGSGDAVAEDVRRLGGFGVAAHPDSAKSALRWSSAAAPDGIEWINLDSEWRDESRATLARAATAYPIRPGPALALVLDRPATLQRWDGLTRQERVVALGAVDAHGGVGRRLEDENRRSIAGAAGIPSYAASFATLSNRVVLDKPLSGEAAADARAIYAAIRGGRVFTSIDALARPALLDFRIESPAATTAMGAEVADFKGATLVARATRPRGAELTLLRDGVPTASTRDAELRLAVPAAGAYRVEVRLARGDSTVPWLVSNPIYVGRTFERPVETASTAPAIEPAPIAPFPWRIEKDSSSSGILRSSDRDATLEFKLGGGGRSSQFVALASDLARQRFSAIDLTLASDRPMRVSIQLRSGEGKRWGRSYYVDPAGSKLHVPIGDLRPVSGQSGAALDSLAVTSLLIVVDLTNAAPGRSGSLTVRSSAFE